MANHYQNDTGEMISSAKRGIFSYGRNFAYVDFFRYILPVLKDTSSGLLLDIGSGRGLVGLCLAELGYRVVGIDDSPEAVAASKATARAMMLEDRVHFDRTDLMSFSAEDGFDVILCLDRIEHSANDEEFLSRVRELMVQDGLLILSTPLRTAPLTKVGMTRRFDESVGHLRRYSRNRIVATLMHAGFNIDHWIETEGIIRDALLVLPRARPLVQHIRGEMLTRMVTAVDDFAGRCFGFSKVILFSRRK